MRALGIDIGGSGVKGAVVDTRTGKLVSKRFRLQTPRPATPKAVARTVASVIKHFRWRGPIGCGFPGPILHGIVVTATNLDPAWDNEDAEGLFRKVAGRQVAVLNDADAAGIAEMVFGAGKGIRGVVILLTLGTGIGSAVFVDGILVPNTEFGQMEVRGKIAEQRAAARIRKEERLSWQSWGRRLNVYLRVLETLLYPDLLVIGGGVSRRWKKFSGYLETRAKAIPAQLQNEAGIVGAALYAARRRRPPGHSARKSSRVFDRVDVKRSSPSGKHSFL